MEVVRDHKDNCIIVCSIENLDPMGVHTGDSITVAPAQTLTDKEYQRMRDASIAVLRKIGVETGGSNVQFAVSPQDGRLLVIEMNPRVSRSSALASKATGFPIAKIAAKLAVGYTLDELKQRHHRRGDAGFLRADHRLRRHQDPALHLREIPGRQRPSHHADEVGGRGHGHRPDLPGIAAEGAAGTRDRARRTRPRSSRCRSPTRTAAKLAHELRAPGREPAAVRGRCLPRRLAARAHRRAHLHRSLVPRADRGAGAGGGRGAHRRSRRARPPSGCACSSARASPMHGSRGCSTCRRRPSATSATSSKVRAGLQARRHLRRGVRHLHRLPLLHLRGGVRGEPDQPPQDHDPRRRAEPHRPGDRVRLLLRARRARAARGRLRDHHGQLQSRRPSPPTTTPPTGCTSSRSRSRTCSRSWHVEKPEGVIVQFGGQTPLKLSRALEAAGAPIIGTTPDSIDVAEDRERFQELVRKARPEAAGERHRAHRGPGGAARRAKSVSRSWCGPPTCSAAAPWRSCSTRTTCAPT